MDDLALAAMRATWSDFYQHAIAGGCGCSLTAILRDSGAHGGWCKEGGRLWREWQKVRDAIGTEDV